MFCFRYVSVNTLSNGGGNNNNNNNNNPEIEHNLRINQSINQSLCGGSAARANSPAATNLDSERCSKAGLNQGRKCEVKLEPKHTGSPLTA